MLDDRSQEEVASVSLKLWIIVPALCFGIVGFAVFLLLVHQPQRQEGIGVLTYTAVGFVGLETLMCLIVPRIISQSHRRQIAAGTWKFQGRDLPNIQTDAGRLAMVYFTATIVGCALLEGAAFLALIAYMIDGHPATLAAAGLMLLGVSLHLPVGGRVSAWVEHQLRIIDDAGQLESTE